MEYRIHLVQTKSKKIYVDPEGEEGIYLYPGEIKKAGLKEGMELSREELDRLRTLYAFPRAKRRALGILVKQDITVQELRKKLEQSGNDSQSIDAALSFVISYGYADDYRYAREYLHSRKQRKSYRMIRMELQNKGVASDILNLLFEEEGSQKSEDAAIAVKKYIRRFPGLDQEARQKTCAHFYRKGYDGALIRDILESLEREESY